MTTPVQSNLRFDRSLTRNVTRVNRLGLLLAILFVIKPAMADELEWHRLPPLPDKIGFAGCYAGVSEGVLLVAGGANFPDGPPWEGHPKVWHDRVYALETPDGEWKVCETRLPSRSAYGVSFSVGNEVLLVGGGDADRHSRQVWNMRWTGEDIEISDGPSLPAPIAFMAGAQVGQRLYVLGGIARPQATKALHTGWSIGLDQFPKRNYGESDPAAMQIWRQQRWAPVMEWPGPGLMLPVVGSDGKQLFLFSGVVLESDTSGKSRRVTPYLRDAYVFEPERRKWQKLPPLLRPAAAAANAILINRSLYVLGGDDGSRISEPPQDHPGFVRTVQRLDLDAQTWSQFDGIPVGASRVTLPVVKWRGGWVLPSGEQKPGVRSPDVYWITAGND